MTREYSEPMTCSMGCWDDWSNCDYNHCCWDNRWDGDHSVLRYLSRPDRYTFLSGLQSIHNNHYEDRLFRWKTCKPSHPIGATTELSITPYDREWRRNCPAGSAMIDASSTHSNRKEDRRWTFTCAAVYSSTELTSCRWTGWLNDYDGRVDYECPDQGVIRSIHSKHSNRKEDRRWEFQCCKIYENHVHDCAPCYDNDGSNIHTIVFGTPDAANSDVPCPENWCLNSARIGPSNELLSQDVIEKDYYGDDVYGIMICVVIGILLIINVICGIYYVFRSRKRNKNEYRKVSIQSETDTDIDGNL